MSLILNIFREEKASILSYGADTDGKTDQTGFIQKAINSQSEKGGGVVFFPKGIYLIDAVKSVVLKDNISLEFEKGAILQALPSGEESYQVIRIHDVSNIEILGHLEIRGERDQHTGTTGEWGMGISIKGANNVEITNPTISKSWGDGIYIGSSSKQNFSENIQIVNPVLDNNRRQGVSIISVKNLEIVNAKITNTKGTPPQGGICIEPNNPTEFLEDIKIVNLSTEKNTGSGLLIYPGKLKGTKNPVSIYVDSVKNIKDKYEVKGIESLRGEINVGDAITYRKKR